MGRRARAAGYAPPATERPPWLWVDRAGGIAGLGVRCLAELFAPGPSWGRELLIQSVVVLQRALIALVVINAAFGFSAIGISVGGALASFGAIDRGAAIVPIASLRELGVLVTASVTAGAIGTMITAEIGARKIRGELDALSVLGVNPTRNLVLPRVMAVVLVMPMLNLAGFLASIAGSYLGIVVFYGASPDAFALQFISNTSWLDLWASQGKALMFGVIIGLVSTYKGLSVTGSAEGVGRAVNECVVASILACGAVGLLYSALFLAIYPDVSVPR